jgi:hypothetical protein
MMAVAQNLWAQRGHYVQAFITDRRVVTAVTGIAISASFAMVSAVAKWLGFNRPDPVLDALRYSFSEFDGVDMSNTTDVALKIRGIGKQLREIERSLATFETNQNVIESAYELMRDSSSSGSASLEPIPGRSDLQQLPQFDSKNPTKAVISLHTWLTLVPELRSQLSKITKEAKTANEKVQNIAEKNELELKRLQVECKKREDAMQQGYETRLAACEKRREESETKRTDCLKDLAVTKTQNDQCNVTKNKCETDLRNCEHKGVFGRTFCWFN